MILELLSDPTILSGLIALLCFTPGLIFSVMAAIGVLRVLRSLGWSQTNGTITWSGARAKMDAEGSSTFQVGANYSYTVGDQTFEGDRVRFGASGSAFHKAQERKAQAKYPVGKEVPVYYNSKKPSDAVLERKILGFWFEGLVGILGLLIGSVAVFVFITRILAQFGAQF